MPAPVITFTANPLAETTLQLGASPRWGRTHRAMSHSFQVGGKGFNVAKMLHRLGAPVTALSFAGGTAGEACRQWLHDHATYPWHLLPMAHATRSGTVVRPPEGDETTFLGPDCHLDAPAVQAATDYLRSADPAACLALCGSVPDWDADAFAPLRNFFLETVEASRLVVDTYGAALAALVQRPVGLVKINRDEFCALAAGLGLAPDLAAVAAQLPPRAWIVTDGPHPITTWTSSGPAQLEPPPLSQPVSATGSGDVFLATLLAGDWPNHAAWPQLLARAADYAARNAAHPGIAEFELPL